MITALRAHRIDYTAVFGGIDDVTAALQGVKLRTFPYNRYLGAAGNYPNAVFVASDKDIAARGPILARALKALAQGYEFAAHHPAAAEQILIADNRTALGNATKIIDATGNATAPHFLDHAGVWGPQSDADYAGLERILAGAHLIKRSPALRARSTRTRCCHRHERAARGSPRGAWPPALVAAVLVLVVGPGRQRRPRQPLAARARGSSSRAPGATAPTSRRRCGRPRRRRCSGSRSRSSARSCSRSRSTGRARSAAAIYPLMVVSQTIPLIALAPLVIIWFGFGAAPKVVLVALFTFFATAVGTIQGLGSADPDAMSAAAHDGREPARSCSGGCACRARCRSSSPA